MVMPMEAAAETVLGMRENDVRLQLADQIPSAIQSFPKPLRSPGLEMACGTCPLLLLPPGSSFR